MNDFGKHVRGTPGNRFSQAPPEFASFGILRRELRYSVDKIFTAKPKRNVQEHGNAVAVPVGFGDAKNRFAASIPCEDESIEVPNQSLLEII